MAKKLMALLLVMIMVIGLVACGQKGNTNDPTDPPKQNDNKDPAVEQTEAPTMADPSTVKFTVAIETALEDASVMPMFQMISEGTGYYPDYVEISPAAASEQFELMWLEDDIPNFLTLSGLSTAKCKELYDEGLIVDLAPYITPELCPNMYTYLQDHEWKQLTNSNGQILYLGTFEDTYISRGLAMNMTWLKTLGLEVPTTPDELLEVWRAFKTQDPNGNGIADEIPFAFQQAKNPAMTYLWPMFGMFGEDAPVVDWYLDDEGNVVFGWATESYKEGVKFFQQAYKEGLIDVENFTMDLNTFKGKCQGDTIIYGSVTTFVYTAASQSFTEDVGMEHYDWILPMVNQTTGNSHWLNPGQHPSGLTQICAISADTDPETIKHILKWVDYMYDPYIGTQLDQAPLGYGIYPSENEGYYNNGPDPDADFGEYENYTDWRAAMHTQDLPKCITDYAEGIRNWKVDITSSAIEIVYGERNVEYRAGCVLHNYCTMDAATEEETEISNMYNTEFAAFWKNQMALWITNPDADIDAEWDAYIENLNRLGLQELTEMRQARVDRAQY